MAKMSRNDARLRRHRRVRKNITGTSERPRLCVFRSLTHINAQVIDDNAGNTLAYASTVDHELREKLNGLTKTEQARLVGDLVAKRALEKGVEEVVREKNYNMILCNTTHNGGKELDYLNMLKEKYVDGIIFMTAKVSHEHKEFFRKSHLPVTFINRKCEDIHVASLDIDNYQAAYDMTTFFLKRGHRRVAIIRAPLTDKTSGYERYRGYQDAMESYGIKPDDSLVMRSNFKIESAYKAVKKFLKEQKPITVIFATSDLMAIGAIRCLRDHNLHVPNQVEVAGFDDIPMASYYSPSITTVRQPISEMGKKATRLLIKEIKGEPIKNRKIILPYQLILRESTLKTPVTGE